ncbi:formylglycine-generating enzyme family protein [Prevotellamassilia timonensis]|uniref:formylglycine-generating enzyme family protein n=1 Tax=Prevotellamassilia timonensis TaxID=1852370 RepID=UPI003FEF0485
MNPKHIILTLLLILCPIGMAAQSTITHHKPKPTVTKHKPAAKPKAKPKAKPAPRRNSTHHSGSTSSTNSLSAELNKLINNMVYVSGGTFTMGGTSEQGCEAYDDEKPTHSVTLSGYYICKYEVTQALWQAVMGSNPSYFEGDNLPVEQVSWNDCQTFINRLNSYTGRNFRLPTEAEWEFAAHGGNYSRHYKYSGSNYIGDVAWYDNNSGNRTHPVGTKQPNELGLYDMSGNVYEWCSDWYGSYNSYSRSNPTGPNSGSYRVGRGGSWCNYAWNCRSSNRYSNAPGYRERYLGLRLVLSQL